MPGCELSEAITPPAPDVAELISRYRAVREFTEKLCTPLAVEDYGVQSMPDASPVKWHLAHTSWFFETFVLAGVDAEYRPFHPQYGFLFNSYYNAIGERVARDRRGTLSRPLVSEVYDYRRHVDEHVMRLLTRLDVGQLQHIADTLILGLHHEQQHQELILTDIKHAFACNPLRPAYRSTTALLGNTDRPAPVRTQEQSTCWVAFPAGVRWIGADGAEFAFDNETPRHRQFVEGFQLASRLVTNAEFLEFIAAGGYGRPELWLSDGWDACRTQKWTAPLYWEQVDGSWSMYTLHGMRSLNLAEPVCHISYYEADAFARWAGARLPTEFEWETASHGCAVAGNLLASGLLQPSAANGSTSAAPEQMYGDVWEWTCSPYSAYPGYQPAAGALGEYNGKFMCNQLVLRGGSCVTPPGHIRRTYRNFFAPATRWQFSGLRLAKDL